MSTRTIIAVLILLGAFLAIRYDRKEAQAPNNNLVCTADVFQCPDGSYVARTGPQCQFASCPSTPNSTPTPVPPVSTVQKGTVKGVVTVSPTCGGPDRLPPDPACAPRGYQTTVSFFSTNDMAFRATTDTRGQYSINLPPGTYKVLAKGGGLYPSCPTETVTVGTIGTVTKDISCDSGIR